MGTEKYFSAQIMFTGIRNHPLLAVGMLKMASKCDWDRVQKSTRFLPILFDVTTVTDRATE